ncbi:uncharacterized protein N7479_007450 [Penicillium vulpinum]|uniref:Uncharacterized protein n=1 Tax=Penicillium vulpinum TaxID=29845 RepID=A0A1V6SB74_9EURO|nr:uncharacterized protein N7479_007450 [Penicillium vulpinum]KAJ5960300.1 hypothetical protein N7479_007450 [Penicillium vulpinum]OQE11020.1 hypothetical protein PENVUL_c003G02703 [Penicillium vulpinum]
MENAVQSQKSKDKSFIKLVRARRKKLANKPTTAITALDPSEIPHNFNLTHCLPTEFELSPSKSEPVTVPPHLNSILADYDTATGGSPRNEALIRSRIDAIILATLAKIKRCKGQYFGCTSLIHCLLPITQVKLSGIVDYSLWNGIPMTNMAIIEAKRTPLLESSMLHCLGHMAMIHETRKQSNIRDTSVYGIVTDSYEWIFILIRPNGEYTDKTYQWLHSAQEIISILSRIFSHAAGFNSQNSQSESEDNNSLYTC